MTQLFDPNLVYPSDAEGGRYLELEGTIVDVSAAIAYRGLITIPCVVRTDRGDFHGFARTPMGNRLLPEVGWFATIRVYDLGGGWYPDHRIVSYGSLRSPPGAG